MKYIFETVNKNYEDFASGRVLYNQQGTTSFPVRLGSEIFLRCEEILREAGVDGPYSLYDPCCGGAYFLTTIGFLHGDKLTKIVSSDIDGNMVKLAQRNLSLLSSAGIEERISQIKKMAADYGKTSHAEALQSAMNLKERLSANKNHIAAMSFIADATKEKCIDDKVHIVITDLPYGKIVRWSGAKDEGSAVSGLLDNLLPLLTHTSIVAVISDKKASLRHERYKRADWFQIGKRKVTFLQLAG